MSENIVSVEATELVETDYAVYAQYILRERALPDVRDGCKPVHRRILFAMHEIRLYPARATKKSARIVGEVLGKYHPHGDSAVYQTMARLAQEFSVRYPLVIGQGNFGSIDGDSPAAMRYTEAKLSEVAMEMLDGLGDSTVDWDENFDGSLEEPQVLPGRFPNLLVNGVQGIMTGITTSIPPHNLAEIIDACIYVTTCRKRGWEPKWGTLLDKVRGPDFPTGGIVHISADALREIYTTGKGSVTIEARTEVDGREVLVYEIPYGKKKQSLVERMAKYARDDKLPISNVRDETDRQGMCVRVKPKRGTSGEELERMLLDGVLRRTFNINMLALDGEDLVELNLLSTIEAYLDHRLVVIKRAAQNDLAKVQKRLHIVRGLLVAVEDIDRTIDIIRRSREPRTAKNNLQRKLSVDAAQAQAILDMPLRRLAHLERNKLQDERDRLEGEEKRLDNIIDNEDVRLDIVTEELQGLRRFNDERRTTIEM